MENEQGRTGRIVERSMGEFFREAAVLVGVFGLLDPVLKGGRIGILGVGAVLLVSGVLFLIGLVYTARAEDHS